MNEDEYDDITMFEAVMYLTMLGPVVVYIYIREILNGKRPQKPRVVEGHDDTLFGALVGCNECREARRRRRVFRSWAG